MYVGPYNVPGGYLGVVLGYSQMVGSVSTDESGADGLHDPKPDQLHPEIPFTWPPNTTQLMELFPIGIDPGQFNHFTLTEPEKYGIEFKPTTCLLYHSNTTWSMPGNVERWYEILRNFDFIWAIDLFHNETTAFADVILPDHSFLESMGVAHV